MVAEIAFDTYGDGPAVLLLHGFPMNRKVWRQFADKLGKDFKAYTPDFPGFGESPALTGDTSLDVIADTMLRWMDKRGIASAPLVGHSMGGYVALEMVRKAPQRFPGLCLFHSTAMADSEEKKESRTKVLKFIDDNGVLAFTSNFIQPLFADGNHPAIARVKDITTEATAFAVKQYTVAMRDRRDNRDVIAGFPGAVLLLGGDQDKGIPTKSLMDQASLNSKATAEILVGSGHMGMFEKEEESLRIVQSFLMKIHQPERG